LSFGFIVERDRDVPAVLVLKRDFATVTSLDIAAAIFDWTVGEQDFGLAALKQPGADRPSIAIGMPSWFWKTTLCMGASATQINRSRECDGRFKGG
jgi:hypothetical protein